ncbi:hypothetical protein PN462_22880 [Spirulina sp. CS-785/01]|nr:hypothetical protein [Spirulina sp. CS-785/01]MDB9315975.1 hypothetical protein [Spirulina sp. CS-785/01]
MLIDQEVSRLYGRQSAQGKKHKIRVLYLKLNVLQTLKDQGLTYNAANPK